MNEKLQKVLEDILKSEEKTKEFSKLQTIEEVYSYFENEVPELSEDEFEQFIVDIMDGFEENADILQHVDVASLESVAGGKNNWVRFGAGALALLTFLPSISANPASAKGLPAGGNVSVTKANPKKPQSVDKKQENKEPKQIFMAKEKKTPTKKKYSKIKKWLKRLGIGAAITIATIFAAKETGLLDKVMPERKQDDEIPIIDLDVFANTVLPLFKETKLVEAVKVLKEINDMDKKVIAAKYNSDTRSCLSAMQMSLTIFSGRESRSDEYDAAVHDKLLLEKLNIIREFASKNKISDDLQIFYFDRVSHKVVKPKPSEAVKKLNEYIRKSSGIFGEEIVLKS